MRKTRIFTPGPTPLMPEAQLAMARPIIHHRTAEFKELLLETRRNPARPIPSSIPAARAGARPNKVFRPKPPLKAQRRAGPAIIPGPS